MLEKNRRVWETQYKTAELAPQEAPIETRSALDLFLYHNQASAGKGDQFQKYVEGEQTPSDEWRQSSLFNWWDHCPYTELRQWAFNTLTIPAMSAEVERVES